jgi:hypothetical protein
VGPPGWDSQSEALSESEELEEEEGEVGEGEPEGMRVRNWAAVFFLERKVFEGVPRRERLWRARVKGRMGWRTEATQERGLRTWARVGLWMLEW